MRKIILWLFYVYLILFPFGQLLRIPPQSTQVSLVHFYLTDLVVAIMVALFFASKLIKRESLLNFPLIKPILLFVASSAFSLLVNASQLTIQQTGISFLYLLRLFFYLSIYFVVSDLVQSLKNKREEFFRFLIMVGFITAFFGLLQYLLIPDTRFLSKFGWDDHYFRVIGTFFDPGYLGAILVVTLILLTVKLWPSGILDKRWAIAWILVYLTMALTYSRASYLSFLAGMAVIALVKRNLRFYVKIIGLLAVTIILLPRPGGEGVRLERESTIKFRIINWQHALEIIKDHPLFGVGFNAYRYKQIKYGFVEERISEELAHSAAGVDSSLLFVLATTGIFGFLSYLWLWKRSLQTKNLIVLASGAALLVHSLFTNTLFYPWVMGWWWIILGSENKIPMCQAKTHPVCPNEQGAYEKIN